MSRPWAWTFSTGALFYDTLLNDYFTEERTIIITTHQVEEIENLLTDVMFINHGRIVLNSAVDALPDRFHQVVVGPGQARRRRAPSIRYTSAKFSDAMA